MVYLVDQAGSTIAVRNIGLRCIISSYFVGGWHWGSGSKMATWAFHEVKPLSGDTVIFHLAGRYPSG